jgi:hypothetical protein
MGIFETDYFKLNDKLKKELPDALHHGSSNLWGKAVQFILSPRTFVTRITVLESR